MEHGRGAAGGSRFSLLIPTRNRPHHVVDLVRHVREELGWAMPILIADQSDDGGDQLRSLLPGVDAVEHFAVDRCGTNHGRNEAARRSRSEWLLFLDDDVRPGDDYLEALTSFIDENPWVDAVQCSTQQRDAWQKYLIGEWHAAAGYEPLSRLSPAQHWSGVQWFTGSPQAEHQALAIGVGAGNLAIARKAYFGCGGFDERLRGPGEDREFGLRLWWFGYRCCLCPDAVAFHLREPLGGRRETRSRWAGLFDPEPAPSWIYFHMKWFPGRPTLELIAHYALKFAAKPWKAPVKFIRLFRSIKLARQLIAAGPMYCSNPVPRNKDRTAVQV
jgi:GT2 family glycosyltransferase